METETSDLPTISTNNQQPLADSKIDSLLQATADCASALLSDEDFERGVNRGLEILGTSVEADRLAIAEQHKDPTGQTLGYIVVGYEWLSPHANSQIDHPELSRINCEEFAEDHYKLVLGKHCGGLIETFPEPFRSNQQEKLGVKSTYAIPIMVNGNYWGIIGLDFCQTAKELSDGEIAVLKTSATCIGSAIQREHTRRAKEEVERTALLEQQKAEELQERDRLLKITANAAQALLNSENLDNAIANALQIIGEGIDTDRVVVMEHCGDPTGESLGYAKMLFEWHSPHAVSQLHHPHLQQVSYEGIESWYQQLNKGEAVGGVIEEIPEPVRRGQREIGVKSLYSVPIIINGKYWGLVGFDDCREAKQRSETEISILKTTGACIGSAIQQNRIRQEREQAERQILLEQERVTQLQEHNQVLEQRDCILAATAQASNILLTEEDFDRAVNKALQIIGESINTDRVAVIENWHNPSKPSIPHWRVLYEWNSPDTMPQISHPELTQGSWEGIEEWYELESKGQSISCRLEEMPEPFRSGQAKIDVKVLYSVPIFIEGKFWGAIGFDDCREETHRSEAELNILRTAAACIGGAIEQERTRRAKEKAEHNILQEREKAATERATQLEEHNQVLEQRDYILAATAQASNVLLTGEDFDNAVNRALQIIGESIDTDRIAIVENFDNPSDPSHLYWKITYEWDSAYAISQINHSEVSQGSYEGIEAWKELFSKGQTISCQLEELPEPFRSKMAKIGVKTFNSVPIFIEGKYWGNIGIDDCRVETHRSEAELSILKTAAACIGGAIEQERTRCAKEKAERNILQEREKAAKERAKLLQAVATVANSLLRSVDYTTALPEVLQILGEAAYSDRCNLVQNVTDPNTSKAAVKICAEWCREGIQASIDQILELETALLWEYFPQFQAKLTQGEISSFLVDNLLEPARSILQQQGNVSMTLVPIVVQGEFWGVFGFDYCQKSRLFDEADTAIFAIAVDSIAAAIEREQKDEALRASEKRYRTLFELSNDGIHFLEFDPPIPLNLPIEEQIDRLYSSSRFTDGNPAWEKYCGLSRSEMIGQPLTVVHSTDSEGHRSLMRRLIENGWQITNAESEDIDANGKKRYWLSHLFTTIENDCVVRGWGVANNITALKEAQLALLEAEQARSQELECLNTKLQQALKELSESEKRYRTLFELSNEGIYRFEMEQPFSIELPIDQQLELVYQNCYIAEANNTFADQYKLSSPQEIVEKRLVSFYAQDSQINLDINRTIIENGYKIRNGETEEIDAHGKRRHFLSNVVGDIRDGYVWGGWGMQTDITELKQAQQNLLEAERQRVAQLEESNKILSLRDRWLEATALAANKLLEIADLDAAINAALKILGESLDCDRVCVAQWFEDSTEETCGFIRLLYEWDSQYASRQILHPELKEITYSKEQEDILVSLKKGGFVGGAIDEFPDKFFQTEQMELGVKSTYGVGIFVSDRFWGVLGIDYCREPKRSTLPEIAVFKTAASCVGSAIYRQQIQRQREQAEKTIILEREKAAQEKTAQLEESNQILSLRDRWLEATANAANQLLAIADIDEGINAALKMLGESLDCDRVAVMQHFESSIGQSLGFFRQLYEWDSLGTISQLFHPQLNEISLDGMEEYFAKLQTGEWWGGLIEEFPEPFRSGQIELGVKSTYSVLIFVGDRFWGILGIDYCREPKRLTPAEIAVFKTAASCVGSAIYRQKIQQQREQAERRIILEREKAAQEKAAELTKVNQVLSQSLGKLTDAADLDSFLGEVVLEISHQVSAVGGHIFLYDADNHTLQQRLSVRHGIIYQGAAEHDLPLFHSPFPANITPAFQHMLETGEIVLISVSDTSDLLWPGTPEWHSQMGHQEAAAIAMMIEDKPLGLLGLAFTKKTALKPEELELIYALTNQASLAIQLTNLAQKAKKSALTDERNRMAREIHDTLAQAFTGISLQLEAARKSLNTQPEAAQERLLRAKILAQEGINEARRSVRALRPEALESEDLITALHQLVDKMVSGPDIKVEISIEGKPRSLTSEIEIELFRIAQEAFTNTLRHAQADQIIIQLIYENDTVHLQIKDNGIGFDPQLSQNQGFGLIGMRERCDRLKGNLVINSASDRGTEIIVTV